MKVDLQVETPPKNRMKLVSFKYMQAKPGVYKLRKEEGLAQEYIVSIGGMCYITFIDDETGDPYFYPLVDDELNWKIKGRFTDDKVTVTFSND